MRWIFGIIAIFAVSCSPKLMPSEPSVKVVTEYRDREVHDTTLIYRNKVIDRAGDTVYITNTEYVYKRIKETDTAYVNITDTIRINVPVPYQPTGWTKVKQEFGGLAIGGLIAILITFFIYIFITKLRR